VRTTCMLLALMLFTVACEDKPAPAKSQPVTPPTKNEVAKKMAAGTPDCPTFVNEVRDACTKRFQSGLEIDCHEYATKANMAVKQKRGKLVKDPTGKNTERAGDRMCAMFGKRLREDIAKSATASPTGPKCKELGQRLRARCFSKLGDPAYDTQCSGVLIATGSGLTEDACGVHMTHFK